MRQLKITKSITNRESASLDKYLQEIGREDLITVEEEVELAQRIRKGDRVALEKLTRANLRFVVSVAKQYQNQGLSLPDLINEGNLGLIKAAEKFDETRGFKFISYAVWWIRQSILQALAEQSRIVRLPLNQVGSLNKISKAFSKFEQENERRPSPEELADELEIPVDKISDTLKVSGRHISDIVMFSEASNKEGALFVPRMLDALRERGKIYYGQGSSLDVALLSKYPILEQTENIPHKDRVLRTRLDVNGKQVVAYTGHLDYTHYACYLPRGYSGVTWKKLEAPVTDKAEIEKANNESLRDESIRLVIEDATKSDADFVILGGDFNEPSHLDWTEETKGLWDHNGAVVDWSCSKLLYEAGFRDAYRVKYPNPITHPGFTFPSDNPAMPVERLTWAPEADERDRIDFIYYIPATGWEVEDAVIVGPKSSIIRSQRVEEDSQDTFSTPADIWPTDHKGVLIKFKF